MKILVTGATGFLGGWVLRRLGDEFGLENVYGTGRNKTRADELIKKGYSILTGDLTDAYFVQTFLQDFTHIVHCAARSSPWGSYNLFYNDNVIATKNLLDGIPSIQRFIYISTASLYFNFSDRFQIKEDSELPKKFAMHYASTKYLAEQEVLKYCSHPMIRVVIRPRAIVGAGDTVIVPRLIRAYNAGKFKIIGDGKNVCDFSSVKNIAHAIYLAIIADPDIDGKIFNITDDDPKAIWVLIENALKSLGYQTRLKRINYRLLYILAFFSEFISKMLKRKEPVLTRYGIAVLKYSATLDISEAKKYLNYTPIITTEESINECVESFNKD